MRDTTGNGLEGFADCFPHSYYVYVALLCEIFHMQAFNARLLQEAQKEMARVVLQPGS